MSEETLNILNELSKKETTDLALNIMELTADNMVKDKEIERLNNIINELEKFTNARIQKCYDEGCYIEEFNIYCEYDSKIKELKGSDKE